MIVKPHPATMAAPVSQVPTVSSTALTIALAALLLAAPFRPAMAQASTPAAAAVPPAPGVARDFDAERKAIDDSRTWTKYRYAVAERACYSKFLVNNCIDKAKEVQRGELQVLRERDLEVGDAERAYRATQRDHDQALRRAEYEASLPKRAADEQASREAFERKQQDQALRDAQHNAGAPQRAANAEAYQKKQDDFATKMQEAQQKGAEQARQHEENAKAYQQKQVDAAQRQKELEERRARAAEKQNQGQSSKPSPFGF
ncbi:chemotaxis protein histidine kinase CheA [Cupriavidus metallidurans]|jgi:hypothetical protein|uniref:hypothetical protein n=1 Tax=Cupriavidus TaxID=106589 RepID=UPI000493424D|nr:hypothetical protein [Cupriavidus metallidurans]AVA33458.1 hypothetical protein C3Z06_07335 [Cupriavidus metallidurans]MDE4917628.1 hypothetical protein [Cupriavidus metallidurans]